MKKEEKRMKVTMFSFGYKHGMPADVNMVWDVRFLPNPFWVEEMRHMTGKVKEVADYVIESKEGKEFLRLIEPLLEFLVMKSIDASKEGMLLAVGCTGGRHRSVAVVEQLRLLLSGLPVDLVVYHRDIDLEN